MESTSQGHWKTFFTAWPDDMKKNGIVITVLGESIPFRAFMVTEHTVLLERPTPDPAGSRFVVIGYDQIAILKIIDVVRESTFKGLGFVGKLTGK